MNLFSSTLRLFGLGKLANPDKGPQHSGPTSRGTEAGIIVSDERAMQVAAVWSCVRLISETVASLPLQFFRTIDNNRERLDRSHPVVELFTRRPNLMMTPQEFREAMTCQLALWGNGYARIGWSGERPVSLTPLKPEAVTPVRLNGEITYHVQTGNGVEVLAKRSVLHLKGFGTDGVIGLSPLSYARSVLGVTVSADKYAASNFANGGRPGGVLTLDRFLEPKQRELVRELYSNLSATADNAGKLWVLEGGMKYEGIAIPPDDMQMLQSRQFQLGEIARIFRVPSHLINDTEKSTSWGSGIEQMNLGFLQYTLQPYLTRWESTLSDALLAPVDRGQVVIEHKVEGLLRADSAARASFYSTMVQNGLMTRNQVRRLENWPVMDGADELTAQVNLAPLGMLGVPPPATPKSEAATVNVRVDQPPVTVNTPAVTVDAPPVIVHSHPAPAGDENRADPGIERITEILERAADGMPTKSRIKTVFRDQIREVIEVDDYGMPKTVISRDATADEMAR